MERGSRCRSREDAIGRQGPARTRAGGVGRMGGTGWGGSERG